MCIDKESYAKGLNKGASEPANGLFPDSFDFGGKDLKGYSYDLEGAKNYWMKRVIKIQTETVL